MITEKTVKKNTAHNYSIKKPKLDLSKKKKLHPLYVLNEIATSELHL